MQPARLLLLLLATAMTGCVSETDDGEEVMSSADAIRAPAAGAFSFGRDIKERINKVPITKNGSPAVVYSVPVAALGADERLAVRGEVTLSTCVPSEGAPCRRVTPFTPRFAAKIVLGASPKDANGPKLSGSPDAGCTRREHHCTLVIDESITRGHTGNKFVNLVVEARGDGNAQDIMKVEDDHGGVYVTRIGKGANADGRRVKGDDVSPNWMKIDNVDSNNGGSRRDSHVVFRAKVDNVRPNDILDVDARIEAVVDDGACDPLIMHQVFVSKDGQGDPEKDDIVRLTAQNGTNCIGSRCTFRKSGAGQLPNNAPQTVWVSVVAKAGRSCTQAGDRWRVGGGSGLDVRVRR